MKPNQILSFVVVAFLAGAMVVGFSGADVLDTSGMNATTQATAITIGDIAVWAIPALGFAAIILAGVNMLKGGRKR